MVWGSVAPSGENIGYLVQYSVSIAYHQKGYLPEAQQQVIESLQKHASRVTTDTNLDGRDG